jgi:hypothetical protein
LSRVKTLAGLHIEGLDCNKIRANQQIVDFYNSLEV